MGQYWPTVATVSTGFGNTATVVNTLAKKAGVTIPLPGPSQQAEQLLAHAKAINAHAEQGEWCRTQILELLSRPF